MRTWWPYLDLARGVAALLVALSHLRGFVFVDFYAVDHPGFVWSSFYFVTGFGHQAVMVFFVLSGFLVGGTVVSRAKAGQWSRIDYAITRMTRLWIVLLPALLLTALWDNLGIAITGSPFYNGGMTAIYNSGPLPDPSRYNVASFFGNLTFLQTIVVPTFGSNDPLWSLANEFWYYFLFPLLFCSVAAKAKVGVKLSGVATALAICYVLPTGLLIYGLIWMLGVAVFVLHKKVTLTRSYRNILLALSGSLLAAALTFSRTRALGVGDFAIGVAFAAMLLPLSQLRRASLMVTKLSRAGAEFSYTLYLVHFPVAAFLACYVLDNRRLMPSLTSATIFVGLLAIVILYAYGVYFLFERNTRAAKQVIAQLVVQFYPSKASKATVEWAIRSVFAPIFDAKKCHRGLVGDGEKARCFLHFEMTRRANRRIIKYFAIALAGACNPSIRLRSPTRFQELLPLELCLYSNIDPVLQSPSPPRLVGVNPPEPSPNGPPLQ